MMMKRRRKQQIQRVVIDEIDRDERAFANWTNGCSRRIRTAENGRDFVLRHADEPSRVTE